MASCVPRCAPGGGVVSAPHAVATFSGQLAMSARRWVPVIEGGPRAMRDGASALEAAGLVGYTVPVIRVSVPRAPGCDIVTPRSRSVRTRRWSVDDAQPGSRPVRARSPVAAVRAGLWALSDRQAALVLTMAVQQRLVTAEQLGAEMLRVRRHWRRLLLHQVILDLLGGVQSMGELDVVRGCRRRSIPSPDSQVLRLPLLGLRIDPDAFFDQVRQALVAGGWVPDPAA